MKRVIAALEVMFPIIFLRLDIDDGHRLLAVDPSLKDKADEA